MMNKIYSGVAALSGLLLAQICVASVEFTAVALTGERAYFGHRVYAPAVEEGVFRSSLIEVPLAGGRAVRIDLPSPWAAQEIRALVPMPESLLVLSQVTTGDAGAVEAAIYFTARKEWKSLGRSKCRQPTGFILQKDRLRLSCGEPANDWNLTVPAMPAGGNQALPQTKSKRDGAEASYDGTQALLRADGTVRLLRAGSFK